MQRIKKFYLLFILILVLTLSICLSACFDEGEEEEKGSEESVTVKYYVYDEYDNYVVKELAVGTTETIPFYNTKVNFLGYYTQKDGQGVQITDSTGKILDSFYEQRTQTIYNAYPKYEGIPYTLTLVSSTGEPYEAYQLTSLDSQSLPEAHKIGYYFMGWSTDSNEYYSFGDSTYNSISKCTFTSDTVLYPKFRAKDITVYGSDEEYPNNKTEILYGQEFTLTHRDVTGKNFMGYYTQQNGQGTKVTGVDGKSIGVFLYEEGQEEVNVVTYYAYFIEGTMYQAVLHNDGYINGLWVTYRNYDPDNEDTAKRDKTEYVSYGSRIQYYKPTRKGYYFDGWYEDSSLHTKFDFDMSRKVIGNFTLYPKWVAQPTNASSLQIVGILSELETGTVTVNNNVNTYSIKGYTCDFDGTITVSYRAYTANGSSHGAKVTIGGTNLGVANDGVTYTTTVNVTKGKTLYFSGEPVSGSESLTLWYKIESGKPTYTSEVKADIPIDLTYIVTLNNTFKFDVYTKSGYTFDGYYSTSTFDPSTRLTDSVGQSIGVWTIESDDPQGIQIYAKYVQNP